MTVPAGGAAAWFSRRVIEGERPGYVERTPDRIDEFDTGWRFYVGDESQEYLDTTDNCVMQHLGHALERWSEVADCSRSPLPPASGSGTTPRHASGHSKASSA